MNPWLKGLVAAAINGAATAVLAVLVDPHTLGEPWMLAKLAAGGSIIATLNYLKQSPLP
jgi:hypothetical protein